MKTIEQLPFAMQTLDTTTNETRGYSPYPSQWEYNPKTQTTNQLLMGKTEPTTFSSVSSTGFWDKDGDEGADDTGTD